MDKCRSAWAEVSKEALEVNIRCIKEKLPEKTRFCAVLKGDAYGHDLVKMTRFLTGAKLVDMVAVGQFSELKILHGHCAGNEVEKLVLGYCKAQELDEAFEMGDLSPEGILLSIYSLPHFLELEELAKRRGIVLHAHLRVDPMATAMGLSMDTVLWQEDIFFSSEHLKITGIYSHFYSSYGDDEEKIRRDLQDFDGFLRKLKPQHREGLTIHVCNSALVFRFPEYAYSMVRVGTAIYGLPCWDNGKLRPVLRICAKVFAVKTIPADASISYHTSEAPSMRRIARIMLGYWDVPLLLTQRGVRIQIQGHLFRLADEPCMDNLCIDVTGAEEVSAGDTAVLLGEKGVRVEEVMRRCGIEEVHSEWLSMTARRLEKLYV